MRKRVALAIAAAAATGLMVAPLTASASSHREAPLIAEDPLADNTDLYAFVAPDDSNRTVIVANYVPFENPAGGPNFYRFGDDVAYQIHIDNRGDARDHLVFTFQFQTRTVDASTFLYNTGPISFDSSTKTYTNWNRPQSYSVTMTNTDTGSSAVIGSNLLTPPDVVGARSTGSAQNYHMLAKKAEYTLPNGVKVFAGQRDDPFFANLGGVFDLLNFSGATTGAEDYLAGINVHSIVLSVPSGMLTAGGDPVIGVWATASRKAMTVLNGNGTKTESGNWVQVSRLGNPLVNEVVIGLNQKDLFNGSTPSGDGQFLSRVTDPILATYLNAFFPGLGGGSAPEHNRNDLVTVFLTGIQGLNQPAHLTAPGEELRLNTSIPPSSQNPNAVNPLGVLGGQLDGFPNGRRLADDVVDIEVQAVLGILCQAGGPLAGPTPCRAGSVPDVGDGVRANDVPFQASFPYVADPHAP